MRKKILIGQYEISWSVCTWKDWLPFMVAVGVISLTFIGLSLYYA